VLTASAYLSPRDVSVILHSFARIRYRDDKMLSTVVPVILKHLDSFSNRELTTILNSFKKLEFNKIHFLDLIVNQLMLNYPDWNEIDVPLMVNSLSYFKIFHEEFWRLISKFVNKNSNCLNSLGISLIIGGISRLDLRNEKILAPITRKILTDRLPFSHETLSVTVNGFCKLAWTPPHLMEYFESTVSTLLTTPEYHFDGQSLVTLLHALFCYRPVAELTETHFGIIANSIGRLELLEGWKPNSDQIEKIKTIQKILKMGEILKFIPKQTQLKPRGAEKKRRMPRWEYEVYRIIRDSMKLNVIRKNFKFRDYLHIFIKNQNYETLILCFGPFHYYSNSIRRTAPSLLLQRLYEIEHPNLKIIEIPFYVWNELKTDEDKLLFLYSKGRQALREPDSVETKSLIS
jgi:hypothetical protein